MDTNNLNIFTESLNKLADLSDNFKTFLSKYDLQNLSNDEVDQIYSILAKYLLDPRATTVIAEYFPRNLLHLLTLAVDLDDPEMNYEWHVRNCFVLSKLIDVHPDVETFVINYFDKRPAPFSSLSKDVPRSKKKRIETNREFNVGDVEIVNMVYAFLEKMPFYFKKKWDWSKFMEKYGNHQNDMVKWVYCHCIGMVTNMTEDTLKKFISTKLKQQIADQCSMEHLSVPTRTHDINSVGIDSFDVFETSKVKTMADINGICLPIVNEPITKTKIKIIEVDSTKENLKKIVLGILSNKGINLIGPVGSGKTVLVEYLAEKTGRILGENFIKIQLGDQTDSKVLLGTYRCTDIPGEFIWQPGVLTQAVIDGSWLLLEDIDTASLDIASLLSSLLENGYLTVPGYRDHVPIKYGFQLFVTQRLLPSFSGYHKNLTAATSLLEKQLLNVNIEPLSLDELGYIIKTLYPPLNTITSRIVNIFKYLTENINLNISSADRNSRYITTRDLFKWCSRAVINFDVSSTTSGLNILQDALDIFCYSYSNRDERYNLAKSICSELGIITEKVNYFFNQYKPNLSFTGNQLKSERATLKVIDNVTERSSNFCFTRMASCLLERVMCCIVANEPILLVGETGTGKTSTVQYLAKALGQKLIVINMNQQSDSSDLFGGYKPTEMKFIIGPIKSEFENLFHSFYNAAENKKFLGHINHCFNKERYGDLVKLMQASCGAAIKRIKTEKCDGTEEVRAGKKRKKVRAKKGEFNQSMLYKWNDFSNKLEKLSQQIKHKNVLTFTFIEGSLVKAIQMGCWVLLDEINLASVETLDCLSGLLEGKDSSVSLLERGDKKPILRHKNFTLFACMNPSTDVGKKNLPAGLRNRFTELFVDELTDEKDLLMLVNNYLESITINKKTEDIVKFYSKVRKEAQTTLCDGLGHKPHFSLRSLCRALTIASKNPCGTASRSLYEAFCLSFLTQLDLTSYKIVEGMISRFMVGTEKQLKSVIKQPIPKPSSKQKDEFLQFEGYWITKGDVELEVPDNYILTPSVRKNLKDLTRIVSIGQLPVLLQGDTSVGKTSLITYLAKSSGNKCVRINNHEHTDLQEYIGSYVADASGKLIFREGVLVEAMRKGHWIILDELNLAPSDVLEALNRVLDDNRELFIPETQEVVKAHPKFMLFATQNPPGTYGGRKMLSRAFRNRFVELHFNEIPAVELETILQERCLLAPSYAKKIINVMKDLQTRRRGSAAFAGKHGFITLRDLFRWGDRYRKAEKSTKLYDWDQHLADEGYLVLAGKVRKPEEKLEIIEVIKKHLKRNVCPENLFTLSDNTSPVTKAILEKLYRNKEKYPNIVWTYNMRQMAVLVSKALQFYEPVLIVGETGCGKTTICDVIARNNDKKLVTINCHMHTESSDFIGGLRPVRDHTEDVNKLFEWVDGPLIEAMREGSLFLTDEISLADDSVLERLNSLLEPERSLLLAEKGIDLNNQANSELIIANPDFHFIGTMNPGGDYGKKELSPALRNRFTEIWSEPCSDRKDFTEIINHNLKTDVLNPYNVTFGDLIMDFVEWFKKEEIGKQFSLTIRDVLTWVNFINACSKTIPIKDLYLNGAYITILDSIGSGILNIDGKEKIEAVKLKCKNFLEGTLKNYNIQDVMINMEIDAPEDQFTIGPFSIPNGIHDVPDSKFSFDAPTTFYNTLRVVRSMQLNKPILLEGSPGVGKTSLVTALASATKNKLYRVNLSDQTDISDLFGADLPMEGGKGGQFSWRDGPLLQALKKGHWILLDELNLASQSVLEGLNACLDHRGEIFIPELGKTFQVTSGTKFFGCQNPIKQGGSRRGLPKSFLNRFTQVYVESLTANDYIGILESQFPQIPKDLIGKMVEVNAEIMKGLSKHRFGHLGGPWEYNLRDLTRWCEVVIEKYDETKRYLPEKFVRLIYANRLRKSEDRRAVCEIYEKVFGATPEPERSSVYVTTQKIYVGDTAMDRETSNCGPSSSEKYPDLLVLRNQMSVLRDLCYCVNMNWLAILVGNSGSGKSNVVRTLAGLTGKTLLTLPVTSAMDTSDLLGGFEQTDYTRHLEDLHKQTESFLNVTIHSTLLSQDESSSLKLLRALEKCRGRSKLVAEKQTMAAETQLFIKKLRGLMSLLEDIEKSLTSISVKENIRELLEKGRKLLTLVNDEGGLNAGGKFEWVDSILIKSLINGHWLLVDNVNLCSPAVLDRLNGLLEPNGVLTISERGIDSDGRMIEIKPHKDFRLFFTINPKNGEISRAMRNRGVELYVLNDHYVHHRSLLDIKSLIYSNGIDQENTIDALIKIHEFVSDLIIGEKPNIIHMLQSSFLISQQVNRGINVEEAIISAIMDVYYKPRAGYEFNTNDPENVIKIKISQTLKNEIEPIDFFNPNCTLKISDVTSKSMLSKINQQISVFDKYLTNHKNRLDTTTYYLLNHFYSVTSSEDLKLRYVFVKKYINENPKINILTELNKTFYDTLKNVSWINSVDLPWDKRWISNLKSQNNVFLTLYFLTLKFIGKNNEANGKEFTILNYIEKIKQNIYSDKINDVVIREIIPLLKEFDHYLLENLTTNKNIQISDDESIEIVSCLQWRKLIYLQLQKNIKNIKESKLNEILTQLHIHYKWFIKHCLNKIVKSLKAREDGNMNRIINKINSQLSTHFSYVQKIGKHYKKCLLFPPPVVSERQLDMVLKYDKISDIFDFCKASDRIEEIITTLLTNRDIYIKLSALKYKLGMEENEPEELKWLQTTSKEFVLSKCHKKNKPDMQFAVIIDYFSLLNIYRGRLKSEYEITDVVTIPYNLNGILRRYLETNDKRLLYEINSCTTYYLLNSLSTTPNQIDYGNGKKMDTRLSGHSPILTYLLTECLINENGKIEVKFGEYRSSYSLYNKINIIVWNYFYDISIGSYDFIKLEHNYIINSYNNFLEDFTKSLQITNTSTNDYKEIINSCVDVIRRTSSEKQRKVNDEEEILIQLLQESNENISKIETSTDSVEKLNFIADSYICLNYLKALLNSKLSPIDPQVKREVKRTYLKEEIENFKEIMYSYEIQNEIYTIDEFPLCPRLKEKINGLEEKYGGLEEYRAVRPKTLQYNNILQDVHHAFSTVLSTTTFLEYFARINNSLRKLCAALSTSTNSDINEQDLLATSISSNIESICKVLSKYRSTYPDIIEPLYSNLLELLYGIKLKESLVKKVFMQYNIRRKGINLEKVIRNLIAFPSLHGEQTNCVDATELYLEENLQNYIKNSIKVFRYIKCALLEVYNFTIISSKYLLIRDNNLISHFESLLKRFINVWNKQQENIEKEQLESQSLYKYKSVNKTEEEEIQEEFDELFPSYHDQDFEEFQQHKLDYVQKEKQADIKDDLITLEDVKYVYELHKKFAEIYTKTAWIEPNIPKDTYDHIIPLIEKYKLVKLLLEDTINSLDYTLDKKSLSSLIVLVNIAKNFGNPLSDQKLKGIYNFYRDSNVAEIKNCYHVLKELEQEIKKHLEEWPDHPTLQNVITIITRMYDFDINSPVSRFLTGFEILLTKCHEWEENAHSGVSLQTCISNITAQIICWRKIELNMWKNSLDITYERMNLPIAKWWCYVYNTIDQFETNVISEMDLIDTIQKFITQSNLAEFKNRLELLKLFHCQCVQLKKTESLQNILWNIYNYYLQFLPNINTKIKELRNPIEQKLKGYVKIVRWKDISYWAVKDTLTKTHKIIHKHMREFEKALQNSVQPYLVLTAEKNNLQVGIWDQTKDDSSLMDYNNYISRMSNITNQSLFEEGILRKSDKYFIKSKSLSQQIISSSQYPKLIENLEEFLTQVLESSVRLQNLEIDKTLPQSKQKSQAKSILQQKRRGLSDLFKALSKIGVSFKKGILESNLKDDLKKYIMKPINLGLIFKMVEKSHGNVDQNILKSWSTSESYYLKSQINLDVLQNVVLNPSKDLGVHEIERCKGFPINLKNNIFEQKQKLVDSANDFNQLSIHLTYFKEFCKAKHLVKIEHLNNLIEALKKALVILEEYKVILNTCPDKNDFETNTKDVPLLKDVTKVLCYKNDEVWNDIHSLLSCVLDKTETILTNVVKEIGINVDNMKIHLIPINNLDHLETSIKDIEETLEKLLHILGEIPLSDSLKWIKNVISDYRNELMLTNENSDYKDRFDTFKKRNEEFFTNVLLSIQNLFKKVLRKNDDVEKNEEDILQINHLNLLTKEGIFDCLNLLNAKEILKLIIKMRNDLQKTPLRNCTPFQEVMKNSLPLMDQFLLLYQFLFTQQVAAYRISSKMNSITLNIFIDLITKGFCIPPEFSDEFSAEGSSQKSSGMGLGDGEGEKDVSDKIESEDQLEEAKPDGQENNEKEEDKDCKEEEGGIEMSEDFDSKLQDVEKKGDEEENEDNSDNDGSDLDEQMGETETGADQLDEEIWRSDNEEEEERDENSKEDEKGRGGENLNEEQIGAKENESKEKESGNKKTQDVPLDKELNEEFDDQQIDPYHQNQHEIQEPEPMDLPEDLQLEDGDDKEEESQEENPFDIDEMKDKFREVIPEEQEKGSEENKEEDQHDSSGNDDEDNSDKGEELENSEELKEQGDKEDIENKDVEQNDKEESTENVTSEGLDASNSKSEDTQQPMDVDNNETHSGDKVASNETKTQSNQDTVNITEQENQNDSEGQGQCQNDRSEGGHRDISVSEHTSNTNEEKNVENNKRMGESDSSRSLGDTSLPVKKKLKTVHADNKTEDQEPNTDDQNRNSDIYQHIKESKKHKDQILDAATKEQVEEQKIVHDDKEDDNKENQQSSDEVPISMDDDTDDVNISEMPKEKTQNIDKEEKASDKKTQHPEGKVLQEVENVEVEGEITQTMQVPRGHESFFNQTTGDASERSKYLLQEDLINLRQQIQHQLSTWMQPPTNEAAQRTWEEISAVTSSLAHHLAEQLRLVLEPTQASRLKGDFKTGKRINMRKIIPYIASQFRKDKIWLRRTKPAKREYQIVLAIDDSSSMADNHSKELAFESVSLISKALTLLESGELSILSFGESTEVLHRLCDPFTEKSGANLLQKFQFAEKKTYVGQMLNFATEMLSSSIAKSSALNAKLLVVVSDGRGIFSEGETFVLQAIRNARLSNIFTIFIIIDNPENNSSILDIRRAVFKSDNSIDVQSYMDTFPFPYYIVLRDINSLPSVLSDALRQWFEMVSNRND